WAPRQRSEQRPNVLELPSVEIETVSGIGPQRLSGVAETHSGSSDRYRRSVAPDPADEPAEQAADYPPELARLPPGRHGLPREFVAHNQRERLIAGLAEAVAENGYASTTIAHITRHA